MRIPLDYYKVLGIPLHLSDDQIQQAYQDRLAQLPRRDYSDAAIASRNELFAEAHAVLMSPEQRRAYNQYWWGDSPFFNPFPDEDASESSPDSNSDSLLPYLDIEPTQLMGALLILQDLGEYEVILSLTEDRLHGIEPLDEEAISRPDLILTVALAYLELSREQWQQQQYDAAAKSGIKGLAWLQSDNLFSNVQTEIRQELYKLRPYRILELLNQDQSDPSARSQGLELLKDMIQDRHGIEGKGNDHSGLGIDDFLKFIQQLRHQLSLDEQEQLFVPEVSRPSLAATYLAIHSLITQGLCHKDPQRILDAQTLLRKITNHQDTALEEAICALLLGQTEVATQALKRSQDQTALTAIREQSHGDSDLLPGLYGYTEQWLTSELCPYFADITEKDLCLADYFADTSVQAFIDHHSYTLSPSSAVSSLLDTNPDLTMATQFATYSDDISDQSSSTRRRGFRSRSQGSPQNFASPQTNPSDVSPLPPETSRRLESLEDPSATALPPRPRRRRVSINPWRFGLFLSVLTLGLGGGAFLIAQTLQSPLNRLDTDPLNLSLATAVIEIPDENQSQSLLLPHGTMTQEVAQQVVETWLKRKAITFGSTHNLAALNEILVNPLLGQQQSRAQTDKQQNQYRQYQHQVKILSFEADPSNPQRAVVTARVKEATEYFRSDAPEKSFRRENDDLTVLYSLERQGDLWKIKNIAIKQTH